MSNPLYTFNIQNFNNISNLTLPLYQGLTAITGKSNAGKSSIIKAMDGLLYNHCHKTNIKQGATDLHLTFTNNQTETTLDYHLNQNNNIYVLKSPILGVTKLEKNGASTPPEIDQYLHTNPQYNFWYQMEPPFITSYSPQELYQTLNQSPITNQINNILQQIKTDNKTLSTNIQTNTDQIQVYTQQLQNTQSNLKLLTQIPPIPQYLNTQFTNYTKLKELNSNYLNTQSKLQTYQNYPEFKPEFTLTNQISQFTLLNQYTQIHNQIAILNTQSENHKSKLHQIEAVLNHYSFCPLCNQPLHNHNQEES